MLKFSHLPIGLFALTIATPVFAAEPAGTAMPPHSTTAPATQATVAPKTGAVDLNTATATDLKALPGMTDADAAKIVQGRPYKDPADLVSKKILSDAEFAKIKDRVTASHAKSS